jgi:hypothetical protein
VADGGNDHWYEPVVVPTGITWTDARDSAVRMGGYMATIASAQENAFVFGVIDSPEYWSGVANEHNWGPWLGGYQDPVDTPVPSENWRWVSGEPWNYTNWMRGEPNDTGQEAYLLFFSYRPYTGSDRAAVWNDELNGQIGQGREGFVRAFIVEYDSAIPEPCTLIVWSLLGASGVTLGWWRRKRAG